MVGRHDSNTTARMMARRGKKTNPFYKSKQWINFRSLFLTTYPICVACNAAATHVDHIRSIAMGGEMLDPRNCQSLCHSCHSKKTVEQDGGFGRERR